MSEIYEKKEIFWDTTKDPIDYPDEIKKIYFKIFNINRKKFSNWIGYISKKNFNSFESLIKTPFSRDPYKSSLFKNFIILLILKNYNFSRRLKTLKFASKSIAKTYSDLVKIKETKIIIKKKKNQLLNIFKSLIFSLIIFFYIKILRIKKKFFSDKLTLLHTFLSCEDQIKDYIYPDLRKILKEKRVKNCYFVPIILFTRKFVNLYKNLQQISNQNYLLKENYISFFEFMHCFFSTLFYKNEINKEILKFKNIDLSLIIEDEFYSKFNFYSEFQSKLIFKFISKIKQYNFKLKKSIGRFENQEIDKAWFYGMRKFYPNSDIFGFQGNLYYPHLLNQSPTFYENRLGLLPQKIIVTNKISLINRSEFFKKANIEIGPSLGKQKVFKQFKLSCNYKFVIVFCGIKSVDEKIISWLIYSLENDKNLSCYIKPHPTLPENKLSNYGLLKSFNRCMVIKKNIEHVLRKTEIIISSGPTGAVFESLIYGCKVFYLLLDPSDNLMFKKIPIKKNYIFLINNKKNLLKNIKIWKNKKYIKKKNNYKSLFFTKINNKNLKLFY